MRWRTRSVGLALVALLLATSATAAQRQGWISGCVTDGLVVPVPGVGVEVRASPGGTPDTGTLFAVPDGAPRVIAPDPADALIKPWIRHVVADGGGCYTVRDLPAGIYTVRAGIQGWFVRYVRTLRIVGDARLDIVLDELPTLWHLADAVLWFRSTDPAHPTVVEVFKKRPGSDLAPGAGSPFAGGLDAPLPSGDDVILFVRVSGSDVLPAIPRSTHRVIATFSLRDGRVSRTGTDAGSTAAKANDFVLRLRGMQRATPAPGRVKGCASDRSGAILPGVSVELEGAGPTRTAITDGRGCYEFSDLPREVFTAVTARLLGFVPFKRLGVDLRSVSVVDVSFSLAVGPVLGKPLQVDGLPPRRIAGCAWNDASRPMRAKVTVTLTGDGGKWSATTDEKGCYVIDHIPQGSYTLKAESPGFQSITARVSVSYRDDVAIDVTMGPGRTDLVEIVRADTRVFGVLADVVLLDEYNPSLSELWARADAVLYLRVEESLGAGPWPLGGNLMSRVVSTEYQARISEVLKSHALGGPFGRALRFLQTFAGVWRDEGGRSWRSTGGHWDVDPYPAGEELVVFVYWDAPVERFCRILGFPVRDGRVFSGRANVKAITEGMPVEELLAALRAIGKPPGTEE